MNEALERIGSLAAAMARLRHDITRHFASAYAALPAGPGGLPAKAALQPVLLKPCLPHMVVLDCADPAAPRYRLAGEAYIQLLGANPTGRPYLDFVPAERHATASESYVACMAHGCGMLTELVATTRIGHEVVCEALNLPAVDDGRPGLARYLFVVLMPLGDAGWVHEDARFSQYRAVRYRAFIDLGGGTPATFGGRTIAAPAG